jgi:hypothetical protein
MGFEFIGERLAGILTALAGIEDLRRPLTRKRVVQGFQAKAGIHRVRQAPAQDFATVPVHHCDQVEKTFGHRNTGNISRPHLMRSGNCQIFQQIGMTL